jgi:GMP synthase PP-ATPase subunit
VCQLNQFINPTRLGQQIAACTLCQDKQLIPEARPIFQLPETARIGVELGLPHDMVYRHPFPG